ncbi:MAG TPA: hypothetical protein VK186_01930 [Candidatus Deferrimicrobium sp.]|nr:hypothetical protein [Candidatus Deferrimicrobium sp.]
MSILKKFQKSKFHLILSVLPLIILAAAVKAVCHFSGFEFIPKELTSFFPSILTGIIFILGFLLAGVVTDFKECERIPNEIATSLYVIWQEALISKKNTQSPVVENLLDKLKQFVPVLKGDFLVHGGMKIFVAIDSFSDDFGDLEKVIPPPFLTRMKNEQANLRKLINRIKVVKDTQFAPSVMISIKAISAVFLLFYCLLKVEPWWGGLMLVMIFTFVIFSIIFLVKDMEDPFQYEEDGAGSDEVDLGVLDRFHEEANSGNR